MLDCLMNAESGSAACPAANSTTLHHLLHTQEGEEAVSYARDNENPPSELQVPRLAAMQIPWHSDGKYAVTAGDGR